jgi:hypothetical protein
MLPVSQDRFTTCVWDAPGSSSYDHHGAAGFRLLSPCSVRPIVCFSMFDVLCICWRYESRNPTHSDSWALYFRSVMRREWPMCAVPAQLRQAAVLRRARTRTGRRAGASRDRFGWGDARFLRRVGNDGAGACGDAWGRMPCQICRHTADSLLRYWCHPGGEATGRLRRSLASREGFLSEHIRSPAAAHPSRLGGTTLLKKTGQCKERACAASPCALPVLIRPDRPRLGQSAHCSVSRAIFHPSGLVAIFIRFVREVPAISS